MQTIIPIQLQEQQMSPGFRSVGLRGTLPTGHLLNIDHFHMSLPTFPPHPHAGFSAVTYMLEDSPGSFINRDSRGDRSEIGPGTLHWTLAGSGVIHEEVPASPGVDCHGLQIFVKLPRSHEETTPAAFHVESSNVPEVSRDGARVRILSGSFQGNVSSISLPVSTTLLDVQLAPRADLVIDIPAGEEAFAMVLAGEGTVDGVGVRANMATSLRAGAIRVTASQHSLQLVVSHSPPLADDVYWSGPFCMTEPRRLETAIRRYRAGAMGSLAPSFR